MPWLRPQFFLLLLILATLGPPGVSSENNVGCLFSERICLDDEICYDDLAFGRCLSSTGNLNSEDIYRYNLNQESLYDLNKEFSRLFALGYRWRHAYTQCRIQGMLFALRHQLAFGQDSCYDLADNDLEGALRVLEGEVEANPDEIAIIKYRPSIDNPRENYADEIYYPPAQIVSDIEPSQQIDEGTFQRENPNQKFEVIEDPYAQYYITKRGYVLPSDEDQYATPFLDGSYPTYKYDRRLMDSLEFLQQYENQFPVDLHSVKLLKQEQKRTAATTQIPEEKLFALINLMNHLELWPKDLERHIKPSDYRKISKVLYRIQQDMGDVELSKKDLYREVLRKLAESEENLNLNPYGLSNGRSLVEPEYDEYNDGNNILLEPRIYYDEDQDNVGGYEYGSGKYPEMYELQDQEQRDQEEMIADGITPRTEFFRELIQQPSIEDNRRLSRDYRKKAMVYTEGGEEEEGKLDDEGNEIGKEHASLDGLSLWDKYNIGFKRPERIDVKKPGPPFDQTITKTSNKKKKFNDELVLQRMKKNPLGVYPHYNYDIFHNRDGNDEYIYINFTQTMNDWNQVQNILGVIAKLLHMEKDDFYGGQVRETSAVSFRVRPNNHRGYNATIVAKSIENIRDGLKKDAHVNVVAVGVGSRDTMRDVVFSRINTRYQYMVIFLVIAVLLALIIATITLILIRRYVKSKEKIQAISRPDTEASKDYQDLCRVRMATKGQTAAEVIHGKGRITSLSRESERESPSSRSSTSSWSEEPALNNMDISTGHMVLSYMEDHLKNKDRLDQEWIALCAYVAEPCETIIGLKKENIEKNRNLEVVPYDHARVILNELINVNGSDYINASSITDHDPRNPAYIATQGPLPQTVPDFWQLIWEQGAVVIVMLTRLTESGNAMCHRYWPEEGSEVYHIYEVHLVSEHIWCDDYLVRSFYLKNIRTGETRTVTQFHFLSWPEASVPSSTKALLEFRRKVNKSYRGRSCPIVVHCSDGAGRTGTYCLIDMVLSRMAKGAKEIDIAATLEHLTDQRPKMVATKQQFEFVLTAVAEEVHAILKALPPQPVPTPQPSTSQG